MLTTTRRGAKAAEVHPILVVDDDPDHRAAVRALLEHGNFSVVANDGRDALAYLMSEKQSPCLIFLDLFMPIMNGWELLAIIKSHTGLAAIPVVLLSAEEPRLDRVRHGVIAAHLPKPYDIDKLLALAAQYGQTVALLGSSTGRGSGWTM